MTQISFTGSHTFIIIIVINRGNKKRGFYDKKTSDRSMFYCAIKLFKYFVHSAANNQRSPAAADFFFPFCCDTDIPRKGLRYSKSLERTKEPHWLSLSRYSKLGASNLCSWLRFFVNSFSISMTSPW